MRRVFITLGPLLLALGACSDNFDTSHTHPARGTIGEEVFGVFCDRLAGQMLREDLSGASFHGVCHKTDGQFASAIDEAALPPVQDGLTDVNGKPVSLADQQAARAHAVARIGALVRRRGDLITALDAVFPDVDVPVLDLGNADPASTCKPATAGGGVRALGPEVSDMLARMTDLYNDDTLPASSRSLARVLDYFRTSPEAQATVARFVGRKGYRPLDIDIGMARPAMGYPGFRSLATETLRLMSFDSDPYAPNAPRNPDGSRQRVPGAGYGAFSKLLEVAHQELRTSTVDPALTPLTFNVDSQLGFTHISRPRSNTELATALLFVQDASFGSGDPLYVVKRDPRGFAALVGPVAAPFVDMDSDGLPDVDALGQFVSTGAEIASPFEVPDGVAASRDSFGRLVSDGKNVFDYVDTSHNFGAQLLSDLHPLSDPAKDVLVNAMGGAYVTLGQRRNVQKNYAPDPGLVDQWNLTHAADDPPPANLGTQPVAVTYSGFDAASAPMADLVYAFGQVLGDRNADELLAYTRVLMTEHNAAMAALVGDALAFKDTANKHSEAQLLAKSPLWDNVLDVAAQITQDRALLEDLLTALGDPAVASTGDLAAHLMQYVDQISYDRNDINNETVNLTTGDHSPPKTPVDRSKADSGANRSDFQRLIDMVVDEDGVTMCNKQGAIVHAKGVPLAGSLDLPLTGSYAECEVLKVDNLTKFYFDAIVGKASFYFRPSILRNGIIGIGAATVDTIQQSTGLQGFWDPPDSKTFRPMPTLLNRMVHFDLANDTQNVTTRAFMNDLVGPNVGTATCPERVITDPVPDAPDAASDGLIHGLRSCAEGDWLNQRHTDVLFLMEQWDSLKILAPLIKPFADHNREDLLIGLFRAFHRSYQSDKGTASECSSDVTAANYCSKSGAVTYEPLLVEALPAGIFHSLNDLTNILKTAGVARCTQIDAVTKNCLQASPVNGITVMADVAETLVNPDHAKEVGLLDRAGNVTAMRNDGTPNAQVTPIYLVLQALQNIDDAFAADAKDPANADRLSKWHAARSAIADQFLGVTRTGGAAAFANPMMTKLTPNLIDLLRAQLWAHCPDALVAPYPRCDWARTELINKFSDTLQGPTVASSMDLFDVVRKDDGARRELEAFLQYITDPASKNQALPSMRAAMVDGMQIMQNDNDLVPFYHIMAQALTNTVRDDQGNVVQASVVDSTTSLLSRMAAHAREADGTPNCSREVDPNQILTIVLKNIVTPMKGPAGQVEKTPYDVIVDVIGDVNRADPTQIGRLEPTDFASVSSEVSDFLVNKERGLEQFYQIIKNGTQ